MTTVKQDSVLSGEIVVLSPAEAETADIKFADGFDLEALKIIDPDPVFATVRIKAGAGDQGAGPDYGNDILQSLETQIRSKRPPGYKGHQDPDKVSWEYREPVTAWVGAQYGTDSEGNGELTVKGYIPPTASDLRQQLKLAGAGADIVNSVSIFGTRSVKDGRVTNFDLWSLDWTPKGRAGMRTELVDVSGEQANNEEEEVDRKQTIDSLQLSEVPEHLATALREEGVASVSGETALAGEIRVILELDESDPEAVIEAVAGLVSKSHAGQIEERLDGALEEVSAEMARAAVKDAVLPVLTINSTEEEIAGEISKALEKPYIKSLSDGTTIPVIQGGSGKTDESREGSSWK